MLELIESGEPFLFANMFVVLVTLAVTVQRIHTLWMKQGQPLDDFMDKVLELVRVGAYADAVNVCAQRKHSAGAVFKAALQRADRSEKEIKRAVEVAAVEELPKVKKGTAYMPQLSNIATLFGLIGTIRGLIISFSGVSSGSAAERQAQLSHGISIAFYNTFFGLTIAVGIIIIYMVVLGRQNKILAEMEKGTAKLIDQLLLRQAIERGKP